MKRDILIDILRGLAIAVMLGANMTSAVLNDSVPFWFRLLCSIPAPLFIFLAGMMVVNGANRGKSFLDFLWRGFIIILTGIGIDAIVFQSIPIDFDVLYLIGFSLPIVYLTQKKAGLSSLLGLIILLKTHWVQSYFGYNFNIPDLGFKDFSLSLPYAKRALSDGWFPIFPWVSLALFGADFMKLRQSGINKNILLLASSFLIFLGSNWWNHINPLREGYTELFYPATLEYVLTMCGIIGLLFVCDDSIVHMKIYKPFELLGNYSLSIYALHVALINWVISRIWTNLTFEPFLILWIGFFAVVVGGLYAKERIKNRISC